MIGSAFFPLQQFVAAARAGAVCNFTLVTLSCFVLFIAVSRGAIGSSCEIPVTCETYGPQVPDCAYRPAIEVPRYPGCDGPKVWVDATHDNGQTITPLSNEEPGRFWGFAALLARDGFSLIESHEPLERLSVDSGPDILVIANAQSVDQSQDAFTSAEVGAITDWVRQGGSLLLVFDHAPFDQIGSLLSRFELEVSPYGVDTRTKNVFSRSDGTLNGAAYASNGLRESDVVDRVTSFRGASFAISTIRNGQIEHTPLLTLPADATGFVMGFKLSIAGRLQGAQIELGAGRVVVLAEAAMVSTQVSAEGVPTGMHKTPGNEQFLLNIMHWLAVVDPGNASNLLPNPEQAPNNPYIAPSDL